MNGVVHDPHPDSSHAKPAQNVAGEELPSLISYSRCNKNDGNEIKRYHDDSLDDHLSIGILGFLGGFEIIINSALESY